MRIAMYISVVVLFLATIAMAFIVYSFETSTLVSTAAESYTVETVNDDTHYNDPICENFNELTKEEVAQHFDATATFAIDQNKHKYEIVSVSSSSTYNPNDMTTKEKVAYLLRCNKSKII